MVGFTASVNPNTVQQEREEVNAQIGFPPLPAGKYQARIVPVYTKGGATVPFEHGPYAKDNPNYAGKMALTLGVQILDESPLGAKRYFRARIPLFSRFAPTAKNPNGAVARGYFDFFEKAMGVPEADVIAGTIPGIEFFAGKHLTITLGAPTAPDQYNPLGTNEIAFYDRAGDVNLTPRLTIGEKVADWLTPVDEHGRYDLDPNWVNPAIAAQQAAAGGGFTGNAASAFGGAPQAPAAAAFGGAQQPAAASAFGAAPQQELSQGGGWMVTPEQAAENAALAQAAQQNHGF